MTANSFADERDLALAARRRGDRAVALKHFQAAAAIQTGNAWMRHEVATELRVLNRLQDAEAALQALLADHPTFHAAERSLGLIARQRGDHNGALARFRAAAAINPNDAWTDHDIATSLRELGALDQAEEAYKKVLAGNPQFFHARHGLGILARRRGDHEGARDNFQEALAIDPAHLGARHELATALRELGRLDEAEAGWRDILVRDPAFLGAHQSLGLIARQRGDRQAALACFRAAAALKTDNPWLQHEVATELRELGRHDEAEQACRDLLTLDPSFFPAHRSLGVIARQRGDRRKALDHFRYAAALKPGDPWTLNDVAAELRELGMLDEAASVFQEILSFSPDFAGAKKGLGLIARHRGDRASALDHFRAASALQPANVWLRCDVAVELRETGRFEEARAAYEEILALDPSFGEAARGLGLVARQFGDHEEALAHFRAAIAVQPNNLAASLDVAAELRTLGRFDEAERVCADAVAERPDSAAALIALAQCRRRRGDRQAVFDLLRKAVQAEPSNAWPKWMLATEHLQFWKLDEAEAAYDSILSGSPDNAGALIGKGQVARRRGKRKIALDYFAAASGSPAPSDWAHIELAKELAEARQFAAAREKLAQVLARMPNNLAALMHIGQIERQAGDHAAAAKAFASVVAQYPRHAQAYVEWAADEFSLGDMARATDLLARALEINPRHVEALESLARHAQAADDLEGALDFYRQATSVDPGRLSAQLGIARCLVNLGRLGECFALLAELRERNGPSPELAMTKAGILTSIGERKAARAALDEATTDFPAHFHLWFLSVTTKIADGAFDEVEDNLSNPPECSVSEMARLDTLRGQLAWTRRDFKTAKRHFAAAVAFKETDAPACQSAAKAALLDLDLEATERFMKRYMKLGVANSALRGQSTNMSQTHIGQLFDEFRMDAEALQRLTAAMKDDGGARLAAILKVARDFPDFTAAAMLLAIELRRQERLISLVQARASKGASMIPPVVIQFWDSQEPPPDIEVLSETWRSMNPALSYIRFSSKSARQYLTEKKEVEALSAFDRAREPAMKADIFRLAYLFHDGGYYTDADDRCIAPIATLDPGGRALIVYQEDLGSIGNNFIGARPGHPVIQRALSNGAAAINRGDSDILWLSTGPGLLTRSFAAWLVDEEPDLARALGSVLILEGHELFSATAIHCLTSYKHTKRHWSRTAFGKRKSAPARRLPSFAPGNFEMELPA